METPNGTSYNEELIESNPAIQGGAFCLKGSRITIYGILEAMKGGQTLKEISQTLKKHFRYSISEKKLKEALEQWEMRINCMFNTQKNKTYEQYFNGTT